MRPPDRGRDTILWLGLPLHDADRMHFDSRNLRVHVTSSLGPTDAVKTARGGVFWFDPGLGLQVRHLRQWLATVGRTCLDAGGLIYLAASNEDGTEFIQRAVTAARLEQRIDKQIRIRQQPQAAEIAEIFAAYEAGPVASTELTLHGESVSPVFEYMLRRAFHDCKSVLIKNLKRARTEAEVKELGPAAEVACVHAVFTNADAGPRPLPFIAKLDKVHHIEKEIDCYRNYVTNYIPFNLRPNLEPSRCLCGAEYGFLVGDFVDHSESLWTAAHRRLAHAAIYSLFDNTLGGWRLQAYEGPLAGIQSKDFLAELKGYFDPARIPPAIVAKAKELGAKQQPDELLKLVQAFGPVPQLTAPMHGDLHADNVCVRGVDAIIIDFQKTRRGPLVADPACLEVSLVFNFANEDNNNGWVEIVDRLYQFEHLVHAPPPAREPTKREWLWTAVRQIRMIALSGQAFWYEYPIALALCLLRRARLGRARPDVNPDDDALRAGYAYVVAERIITKLYEEKRDGGWPKS